MIFIETHLKGSFVIDINLFNDERGWFGRTFCKKEFEEINHKKEWVQMNHSYTKHKGTIRGMHYQNFPYSEIKLVRCIAGKVFDVIIDLRKNSDTFLKWVGVELSAENKKMLYIPEGFAHGFQTLSDDCELIYHHTEFYKADIENGLRYNEKKIGIEWKFNVTHISDRDQQHEYLTENFIGI